MQPTAVLAFSPRPDRACRGDQPDADHRERNAEQYRGGQPAPAPGAAPAGDLDADLAAVARIGAVPTILRVISEVTGLRLALVARVTPDEWRACAVLDRMDFGLAAGDRLDVATTLCSEVRDSQQPIVIEGRGIAKAVRNCSMSGSGTGSDPTAARESAGRTARIHRRSCCLPASVPGGSARTGTLNCAISSKS